MKKLLVLALAVSCLLPSANAQEEVIPPKRGKAAKVGLFGGFTPGYLSVNVAPVNEFLKASGIAPFDQNGMFLWGGAGAAYIMLVPNLRVGGLGMSGSISTGSSVQVPGVGQVQRDARLSVGFGGVTIEYVIPVVERLDIAMGAMLGGGGMDLTLKQNIGGIDSWSNEQKTFAATTWPPNSLNNVTRVLSGSYFIWIPSVNVEYAVLGWLGIRLGASYVGMSFPSWSVDNDYTLNNVPKEVTGEGFMVNAGIFVGTF